MRKLKLTIQQMLGFSVLLLLNYTIKAAVVPPLADALPAKSGSSVMTAKWLLENTSVDEHFDDHAYLQWLSNEQLLYVFPSSNPKDTPHIERFDVQTRTHEILARGDAPLASPDGRWIVYAKGEGKEKQLWLIRDDKSEEKQLSYFAKGISDYGFFYHMAWSPNAKQLYVAYTLPVEPWKMTTPYKSKIFCFDIVTGQSRELADIEGRVSHFSWLPAHDELVLVVEQIGNLSSDGVDRESIKAINVNTGQERALLQLNTLQQMLSPQPSPDGQTIALLYNAEHPIFNYMLSIGLIPSDTASAAPIQLTHEMKLGDLKWALDGKGLYAKRYYGAYKQLNKVDVATGEATSITNLAADIETYALSPDGHHLAWVSSDAHGVLRLQIALQDGTNKEDLVARKPYPKHMALSEVREITWKTKDYPAKMRGLLILPLHYSKHKKYPLIVDIHGGDSGAHLIIRFGGGMLVSTPLEWQLWAAQGYAVFIPEFRSSANFGTLAITRDEFQHHDRLGGDLKDIETGVDYLIKQEIADPKRLAIIGHSAGGLRANWFEVASHRYQAIVSKEGWADEYTPMLSEPPSNRIYTIYGGSPWEVPENYIKNSPIHHAKGANIPILFLMGSSKKEMGGVDSYQTVLNFYHTLQILGVDTQYVIYPDEGHVFQKPKNRQDALERAIKWIDEHINNGVK